ncbi:MAG: AarF/ABC1/UbiB kinase family protein [Pseudomonadota bacterium]
MSVKNPKRSLNPKRSSVRKEKGPDSVPLVPAAQVLKEKTLKIILDTGTFTKQTILLSRTFFPLTRLLASDEDITQEHLSCVLDDIFEQLYQHPLIHQSRKLTQYLRRNNLIPNEKTTEKLIQYVIDQVLLRSPINIPEVVVQEFWIFFHELLNAPEIKGLMELNLDIVRLILKTYEPLLVEVINLLKETKRNTKTKFTVLLAKIRVIRHDLLIIKRQIKAIRYVKPFFQTDPKDFRAQAQIIAKMVREFGPFFIKMAQVAAANSDFLPEEISRELMVFQEDVPPMTPEEVIETIRESFGRPVHECYYGFDPGKPLQSGSIGSVYLAKKPAIENGKEVLIPVIVKIGRNRLDREFLMGKTALNLTILSSHYWAPHSKLAPFLEAIQRQVDEFIKGFQQELDFLKEASIQERFYKRSRESVFWRVPRVYTATPHIIEMEYIPGAQNVMKVLKNIPRKQYKSFTRDIASRLLYTVLLHMIMYREFHGDLHPGNVLVNDLGEIFLIDWGNCVNLEGKWKPFWDYIVGALTADVNLLTDALIRMSADTETNRNRREQIAETLTQTLTRKKITALKWNFVLQLYEEKMDGLHRRLQVVMHLMSNTQHLGLIIRSDYLHLLRSLTAIIGTYIRLYENLPKYLIPFDIAKTAALFPALFIADRMVSGHNRLVHHLVRKLPIPKIFKPELTPVSPLPVFLMDHSGPPVAAKPRYPLQAGVI